MITVRVRIAGKGNRYHQPRWQCRAASAPMVASYPHLLTSFPKSTSYTPQSATCSTTVTDTLMEHASVPSALTTAQLFWGL